MINDDDDDNYHGEEPSSLSEPSIFNFPSTNDISLLHPVNYVNKNIDKNICNYIGTITTTITIVFFLSMKWLI
jgi:hypothetical protein